MPWLLIIELIGLCASLAALLLVRATANPRIRAIEPWTLTVLAGYGIAYAIGLIGITFKPIWDTGGVDVWAEFPEHLIWAIPLMAYSQLIGVPLALAGYAHYRRLRRPA